MAEQRGFRRLTRADVVVVTAVGLLLILLVPVLFARPREQVMRTICAENLAKIGKAMAGYTDENDGWFPRAGGRTTAWGEMPSSTAWMMPDRRMAFGMTADGSGGTASISASLYLLVKHFQVRPRTFVCKSDRGTTAFKLSDQQGLRTAFELTDAWDFGPPTESFRHSSYAYHIPYNLYSLRTSAVPDLAVLADRNPWILSPASDPMRFVDFRPDIPFAGGAIGTSATARMGNSITHQQDGQNVLFLDGRVIFEKRAYCAVERDNIYTLSTDTTGKGSVLGVMPLPVAGLSPTNRNDSLLVHDPGPRSTAIKRR
ncbi:MAG: hypothetical protein JW955_02935 [Sedimentisphaerales bacterium]|nr:hypothetical protein [Sedimentisphaerales bacterium]